MKIMNNIEASARLWAVAIVLVLASAGQAQLPETFNVTVNVQGQSKTLALAKYSIRPSNYRVMTWDSTNGYVTIHDELGGPSLEVRTYRGYISQNPNHLVTAVVLPNNTLRAEAHSGKGELWSVSGIDVSGIPGGDGAPPVPASFTATSSDVSIARLKEG